MKDDFKQVETMRYWCQKVLPLVYDDSLSYYELLGKIVKKLNVLIENNAILPEYISKLIQEYISSGAIGEVIRDILTNFMLNVKNPPNDLTPAVGDGTADDTEAIQGCIDYASENGGMAVYFPSGSYLTKSLTMRSNVSLVGFDRYNTRLVLRGGATKGMLEGDVENITINRICFDGNADIQVNNINIINMKVNNAIINDVVVTDGFNLIELETKGNIQINNVIFKHGVLNGLILKGNGLVQANNLMFDSLSDLLGENAVRVLVDNAIITNVTSKVKVFNPIQVTGNNCLIEAKLLGGTTNIIDTGNNNTVRVLGVKDTTKLTEVYEIIANDIALNPINPLTYKTPIELNEYFKTVPFKDSNGSNYNVLVQGKQGVKDAIDKIRTDLEQEITDRENSDGDIYGKINTEKTDREQAINTLRDEMIHDISEIQGGLTQETTERKNSDQELEDRIAQEIENRELAIEDVKKDTSNAFTKGKKIVIFGDSYAQGTGILTDKLKSLLEPNFQASTFYDYSVGGSCFGSFGNFHNLSNQYQNMINESVVPDIVLMMFGNNDANYQMRELLDNSVSPKNTVGTFDNLTPEIGTTIGDLTTVINQLTSYSPNVVIGIIPMFNLSQESDGYFKLASTAIMTQLSILPFYKNVSILWQDNLKTINWGDTSYWANGHPTLKWYETILKPILTGWLNSGLINYSYPNREKGLITTSSYDTNNYFLDICKKINKMRIIGGGQTISPNLAGDYTMFSIGGSIDTVHVYLNSFYNDIYVMYRDINGMKWAKYTTEGELTLKGLDWA